METTTAATQTVHFDQVNDDQDCAVRVFTNAGGNVEISFDAFDPTDNYRARFFHEIVKGCDAASIARGVRRAETFLGTINNED